MENINNINETLMIIIVKINETLMIILLKYYY